MAVFGKSPRGAHDASNRQVPTRGQAGSAPGSERGGRFREKIVPGANRQQQDPHTGQVPRTGQPAVRRQRPDLTGGIQPTRGQATTSQDPISSSKPTIMEAAGSYAELASQEGTQQNLGPVVISLRNVTKMYASQSGKPALDSLSLDIHAGEFLFLVGHSGSGKSTFIRMLNREVIPSSGELIVAGENLRTIRKWRIPYLRRNVGCVFQDFKLLPNKTAFENVAFALEAIGKSKHVVNTQVPEVLRLVGLEEKMDNLPDQLSGGEQQRVSIARSIVNRPPLLICDEPTGNLDPQTSLGIMRLLERINRTGTTVLVATHDREMVDQMRRRVLALENGVLVRDQKKGVYGYDV